MNNGTNYYAYVEGGDESTDIIAYSAVPLDSMEHFTMF